MIDFIVISYIIAVIINQDHHFKTIILSYAVNKTKILSKF
ncbi:hypothetical protein AO366_1760 [Moraxella catarrhalis]|nr:hypothetical protein AO377_0297 [Moraxella catarrhalis]OAV15654.1 hypothetical protein AO375_0612 [Moraxella catarrhalis]OAV15986.1 hypothetical protein AO376_0321 [Moraxella catarrhalis]OAV16981.1 hypothetical protein AO374_1516 [Moraxella catarrhalis]OAV20291.1 hypothetical protein AO372_1349 [Moraxella catarrhalis]